MSKSTVNSSRVVKSLTFARSSVAEKTILRPSGDQDGVSQIDTSRVIGNANWLSWPAAGTAQTQIAWSVAWA